jgi:hypothetical protein
MNRINSAFRFLLTEPKCPLSVPVATTSADSPNGTQKMRDELTTDPPMDEVRRGQRVRYGVDHETVSRMYLQLGQAIGEI